ncbi:MAG: TrsK protein [Bacteroidetes bacterium]|nr:MAG: TrsK protein [Bacteroidota bacterium]
MIHLLEKFIELIVHLLEALFKLLAELFEMAVDRFSKKNKTYDAKFIRGSDLLSNRNIGFCLTGDTSLSVKNSYQNALVIGGTGVGKSSVVLIPSLYSMTSSFVIHDPSGELFQKTAGHLHARGYAVKVLNFSKPSVSAGYNPLARAHTSSEIQKVASMLVENSLGGTGKADPFWNTQATALLSMLITILKTQAPEYQNLYNVRQLLNQLGGDLKNPNAVNPVDTLFAKHADPILFNEYKSFIAYEEKVISSVIATCKAALQLFSDAAVAAVTSFDTLPMDEWRTGRVALFIQNSIADQRYYSALTSIFFEQFFAYVLSRFPDNSEQDIFFLVDEASSLKFPTLPLAVANVRKHRAGIMLLVQDFNQLTRNYGKHDAEAIRSNCFTKMYFTGQGLETTKELEQILGRFEYKDKDGKTVVRPLMTSDEIRIMNIKLALLLIGHHPPIKAKLKPYYEINEYRRWSEFPPPVITVSTPTQPAVLPL